MPGKGGKWPCAACLLFELVFDGRYSLGEILELCAHFFDFFQDLLGASIRSPRAGQRLNSLADADEFRRLSFRSHRRIRV